jgi:hypothetical protein
MLDFNLTFEEKEHKAKIIEDIYSERVLKLKESQEKFKIWEGIRTDNGYLEKIKEAEDKLQKHINENIEYLI